MSVEARGADSAATDEAGSTAEVVTDAGTHAARRRGQRVPDFFVIGHQKCGTTALYYMLKDHPQIFLSEFKEPRFFSPELRPPLPRETLDRPQTLERYLSIFAEAHPEQRVGDTSPQYIRSPTAAARIAEMEPDARIIAIMREPASFLRSYHMQMVDSHVETEKNFQKAIGLENRRRESATGGSFVPPQFLYSDHVRYVEQLRRFEACFGRDRMLVLIYDDFRDDNEATVRTVQRFLEVDDTVPIETVQTEPLKAVRSMHLHRLRQAVARADFNPETASLRVRTLTTLVPKKLRSGTLASAARRVAYAAPSEPAEEFMRDLRLRFRPEVVALSEYLGRDLVALWGYSDLD